MPKAKRRSLSKRREVGAAVSLALGLALLGIGFTMLGYLSRGFGMAFVFMGLLLFVAGVIEFYSLLHSRHSVSAPGSELWTTALKARLEMQYGEHSIPAQERIRLADIRLKELKAEINSGNFSNAQEVLLLKPILLDLGASFWGTSAGVYGGWRTRIYELVAVVEKHLAETEGREGGD